MLIEQFKPYIEDLLRSEPWRAAVGDRNVLCRGNLDWDGTERWLCQECGRIGTAGMTLHAPALDLKKLLFAFFEHLFTTIARVILQPA